MSTIDGSSLFDQAWRSIANDQGRGTDADAMRQLFERRSAELSQRFESAARGEAAPDAAVDGARAADTTADALRAVDAELKGVESLPQDLVAGRVESPHEIAARIRRADLTLKFSLEIRNRLVEAYREVMRMTV